MLTTFTLTPFLSLTAPPTNQSAFNQWTIGPIFYSVLIMPEVLGKSNTSRVVDLWPNSGNELTPAYAIYENNQLARVALFNYMTDPTGGMAYTANISIGGGQTGQAQSAPATVQVKCVSRPIYRACYSLTRTPGISLPTPSASSSTSHGRTG